MFNLLKQTFLIIVIAISVLTSSYAQVTEPQMIFVKGGAFKMGSKKGDYDEKPVHQVVLSNYYIGKFEITVKQYREFCNATGKKMPPMPTEEWYEEHDQAEKWVWKDNNPIAKINWHNATAYCKWLSKETGKNYSLPTEAQWEYAAKGGNKSKNNLYSGSDNINEVAWYDETTYEKGTRPVGRLKPNEIGIYDMSGNVWEWCKDNYARYKSGTQKNPKGPEKTNFRVIRGGSWYYVGEMTKVTTRDGPYPHYSNFNYGFRVVINP